MGLLPLVSHRPKPEFSLAPNRLNSTTRGLNNVYNLDPSTRQEIRQGAGWGIAVGVLLIILGIVAIALLFATAISLGLLLGWLFILGGIAQIVYAFVSRRAGSFIWKLLLGVFYLLGGILVLLSPGIAALTLSLILGLSILVQSVTQVIAPFKCVLPKAGVGCCLAALWAFTFIKSSPVRPM